ASRRRWAWKYCASARSRWPFLNDSTRSATALSESSPQCAFRVSQSRTSRGSASGLRPASAFSASSSLSSAICFSIASATFSCAAVSVHGCAAGHFAAAPPARRGAGVQTRHRVQRVVLLVLGDLLLDRVGDLLLRRRQRPRLRRRAFRGGGDGRTRGVRAQPRRQLVVDLPLREELLLRAVRRRVELLLQPRAGRAAAQREVLERSAARDP